MEGNTHKYVAEEGSRDLFCCRAPHGARGLKRVGLAEMGDNNKSRPAWGAWIEIHDDIQRRHGEGGALLCRACGLKLLLIIEDSCCSLL